MKLLLTSSGQFVVKNLSNFLDKPVNETKLAYITTASKGQENKSYIQERKIALMKQGYQLEEIDIEGKTEEQLMTLLKDKDVVYVEGGSTFYLLKAVRESGFDKVIKQLIDNGLFYVGSSAGSYICCPTIEMALWKHQDKYDHCGLTDWTALNLAPFLITAHYGEEFKEVVDRTAKESKYDVKFLTDNDALLVENDKVTLINDKQ
jgi:dipeptidase E